MIWKNTMEIDVLFSEDFAVATIKGRIVIGKDIEYAKREIFELIQNCSKDLILDLSEISFIDSSGLGAIASFKNTALLHKKNIILAGVSFQLNRMLEITGLSQIFEIHPTKEEAMLKIKEKKQ